LQCVRTLRATSRLIKRQASPSLRAKQVREAATGTFDPCQHNARREEDTAHDGEILEVTCLLHEPEDVNGPAKKRVCRAAARRILVGLQIHGVRPRFRTLQPIIAAIVVPDKEEAEIHVEDFHHDVDVVWGIGACAVDEHMDLLAILLHGGHPAPAAPLAVAAVLLNVHSRDQIAGCVHVHNDCGFAAESIR